MCETYMDKKSGLHSTPSCSAAQVVGHWTLDTGLDTEKLDTEKLDTGHRTLDIGHRTLNISHYRNKNFVFQKKTTV